MHSLFLLDIVDEVLGWDYGLHFNQHPPPLSDSCSHILSSDATINVQPQKSNHQGNSDNNHLQTTMREGFKKIHEWLGGWLGKLKLYF